MADAIPDDPPPPQRPSIIAIIIDKITAFLGVVPYPLIALGLRFVMARTFFMSGQTKIEGPSIPLSLFGRGDFTVILPAQIKDATFTLFQTQYAGLPLNPTLAAYLFTYAEFVLPVCLVVGFATRLSALALLVLTVLLQVYVAPGALWTMHAYWIAIL